MIKRCREKIFLQLTLLCDTDLAWDETTHLAVDVLNERHIQKGEASFYGGEDVTVAEEWVIPALGFPSGQLTLDLKKVQTV